jgi:hypothetical protein
MHKRFYLICPTDCLEFSINKTFKYENYFYTSLGNSFNYDHRTLGYLRTMIKKHNIQEIYFVLSIDNKIALDALGTKKFSKIGTLNNFYDDIKRQKERSNILFKEKDNQFTMLSFYLNKKIKELEFQLANLSNQTIKIGAKIYHKNQDAFINVYSDLVCLEKYQLN